jgi:hypothetical protein
VQLSVSVLHFVCPFSSICSYHKSAILVTQFLNIYTKVFQFLKNVLLENNFPSVKLITDSIQLIRERYYFPVCHSCISPMWLIYCSLIEVECMKKFITFHDAVKWNIDILKCGPVIFQFVPDVMSRFHYYSQNGLSISCTVTSRSYDHVSSL